MSWVSSSGRVSMLAGAAVAPAIVADVGALGTARRACQMQVVVSPVRMEQSHSGRQSRRVVDRHDSTDGRRFTGRSASVRRPSLRSSAASEARRSASAGTPGPAWVAFRASGHLTRPLSGDDDRGAVNVRLSRCSSRQVLSGDILAAAGVQRTAVQRPPTLRLIMRVPQPDNVHRSY